LTVTTTFLTLCLIFLGAVIAYEVWSVLLKLVKELITGEFNMQTETTDLIPFPWAIPEERFFTQAEAQQLQSLLNVQLFNAESTRTYLKDTARKFKAQGDPEAATAYFNAAEEHSNFIKKFGAIQSKVKHHLETRG